MTIDLDYPLSHLIPPLPVTSGARVSAPSFINPPIASLNGEAVSQQYDGEGF